MENDARFDQVRNACYKHSKKTKDKLFDNPIYGFFFAIMGLTENGKQSTQEFMEFNPYTQEDMVKIHQKITEFSLEARQKISTKAQRVSQQSELTYDIIAHYLEQYLLSIFD